MKCLVCGREYDERAKDKCPRCAFPIIGMTEETEENRRWAQEQAAQYADHLLASCSVSLSVFAYASYVDGTMHFREEREFVLARGEDLKRNRIFWNTQEFAANRELKLDVIFRRRNGMNILERHLKMQVKPPHVSAPWKAGLLVHPDLTAAIVVGNADAFSRSRDFDLLM